jgi:hypothetical protein
VDDVLQPDSGALEVFMHPLHQGSAQASTYGSHHSSLYDLPDAIAASAVGFNSEDSGYFSKSDGE